jgi:hypothetical protein
MEVRILLVLLSDSNWSDPCSTLSFKIRFFEHVVPGTERIVVPLILQKLASQGHFRNQVFFKEYPNGGLDIRAQIREFFDAQVGPKCEFFPAGNETIFVQIQDF